MKKQRNTSVYTCLAFFCCDMEPVAIAVDRIMCNGNSPDTCQLAQSRISRLVVTTGLTISRDKLKVMRLNSTSGDGVEGQEVKTFVYIGLELATTFTLYIICCEGDDAIVIKKRCSWIRVTKPREPDSSNLLPPSLRFLRFSSLRSGNGNPTGKVMFYEYS